MSTRSMIGTMNSDGTVIAVYCHFDGYLDGVGETLDKYYRNPSKVKELIDLGRNGISILGKEIGEKQNFKNPAGRELGWCLFYGRDRGESNSGMYRRFPSIDEFRRGHGQDYGYLYEPDLNIWFAFDGRDLVYIPTQSRSLVNAMWKKVTTNKSNESKQFKLKENKMKLTNKQRQLVKEYIQRLKNKRSLNEGSKKGEILHGGMTFESIKDEFINAINKLTVGAKRVAIDEDGDVGRFKNVSNIGKYTYEFITDNYNSLNEWLEAIEYVHFRNKSKKLNTITISELVASMVYDSIDDKCIGIDDLYSLVLR